MNLRIDFHDLTDEEKQLIYDFEDQYPDQVLTKEISHSFDGATIIQFLVEHSDAIIQALGTVIAAIIAGRYAMKAAKKGNDPAPAPAAAPAEFPTPDKDGVIHIVIHNTSDLEKLNTCIISSPEVKKDAETPE